MRGGGGLILLGGFRGFMRGRGVGLRGESVVLRCDRMAGFAEQVALDRETCGFCSKGEFGGCS